MCGCVNAQYTASTAMYSTVCAYVDPTRHTESRDAVLWMREYADRQTDSAVQRCTDCAVQTQCTVYSVQGAYVDEREG